MLRNRKNGPKWPDPKVFHLKNAKMCFLPRGSILSFEGGILFIISLGLAVRTFWSDLEKCPKSASGKIWGRQFGLGTFLGEKTVSKKKKKKTKKRKEKKLIKPNLPPQKKTSVLLRKTDIFEF